MKSSHLFALFALSCSILGAVVTIFLLKPEKPVNPCEYQFIVTDDSLTVFDGDRTVGTIKLEGQLDSLITIDNK